MFGRPELFQHGGSSWCCVCPRAASVRSVIPAKAGSALFRRSRTSRASPMQDSEVSGFPLSRE
ncbi:hypothetical protein GLE_1914 [Lysobacter enzymogenes]|uniref:Uncharacterized protein n=1 Tax=Lysobacter enzymogenes TaxID=69 RepID=A0A0S2DFG1_LYSEN|nr:hypothetical protein GLE_1914 [Lysobacter enzymogenes]